MNLSDVIQESSLRSLLGGLGLALALMVCSEGSQAAYAMERNKNLPLCREFLEYLNRKPDNYYLRGLEPDSKFKDFRLPKLEEVDKSKYFEAYKSWYFSSAKNKEARALRDRHWESAKANYLSGNYTVYLTYFDINHDGQKERALIGVRDYKIESSGLYVKFYSWVPITEQAAHDASSYFSLHGQPFFYEGRFYVAVLSEGQIYIAEPRIPHGETAGVKAGLGICLYNVL